LGGGGSSGEGAEGEAGPEAGEGNSLMVTVTRLVVTSVTTTSLQLGAISGCQLGSPSAGALWGSTGAELWSRGGAEPTEAAGSWRLARRWRGLFLHASWVVLPSSKEGGDKQGAGGGAWGAGAALWSSWVSAGGPQD